MNDLQFGFAPFAAAVAASAVLTACAFARNAQVIEHVNRTLAFPAGGTLLHSTVNDLAFALRQPRQKPGLGAVAMLLRPISGRTNPNSAPKPSSGKHRQGLVDLDSGVLAVETQDLRRVEDLDANQLIGGAVVQEDMLVGLDRRHFAAGLGQINVRGINLGIVGYLHAARSKIKGQDRDNNQPVPLFPDDRHYLFRSIIPALPSLLKPNVQAEGDSAFSGLDRPTASDRFLDLMPGGASFEHALVGMTAEMDRLHETRSAYPGDFLT